MSDILPVVEGIYHHKVVYHPIGHGNHMLC